MIRKDQQATMHKKGNKIQKALQISNGPPRRSRTVKCETADCIPSSLTLPKLYLATFKLRNLQILKKMLDNSSQFSSSDQPCKLNSSDAALNIEGVEKKTARKTCSCGQHWRPFYSGFIRREEG